MTEIITYVQANWTVWLFGLVGAVLGYIIQKLRAQQKEYRANRRGCPVSSAGKYCSEL